MSTLRLELEFGGRGVRGGNCTSAPSEPAACSAAACDRRRSVSVSDCICRTSSSTSGSALLVVYTSRSFAFPTAREDPSARSFLEGGFDGGNNVCGWTEAERDSEGTGSMCSDRLAGPGARTMTRPPGCSSPLTVGRRYQRERRVGHTRGGHSRFRLLDGPAWDSFNATMSVVYAWLQVHIPLA